MNRFEQGSGMGFEIKRELTASRGKGYYGSMSEEVEYTTLGKFPRGGFEKEVLDRKARFDATPAGRGLRAYKSLKSENDWGAVDYARMLFMIPGGESREADGVRTELNTKVVGKDENFQKEVLRRQADLDNQYRRPDQQKDWNTESVRRGILMNNDLWERMKPEDRAKLSPEQLEDFKRHMSSLTPGGEKAVQEREMLDNLTRGISEEAAKEKRQTSAVKGSGRGGPSEPRGGGGKGGEGKGGGNDNTTIDSF